MKIVVTGALGHIGSALIRSLPAGLPNLELTLIDSLLTQRFCSLFDLPSTARYRFVEADVTKADLRASFEGAHAVIHLAAMTEAAASFSRPEQVEENNFQAVLKVAEASASAGARFFFPSSTSVYGASERTVVEDCLAEELNPQSPYAASKLKEEQLVQDLVRKQGLKVVTCRFGTIFGTSPGMRFHTAVNKFCWQAVMGTPLSVWKTALDQRRPYLALSDALRAIPFLLQQDLFDGRVYNIVTLNATVRDIIDTIRKVVPGVRTNLVDSPIMNQFSYDVSCERIQGAGFAFTGDLLAEVNATIQCLRAANSAGYPSE
jgi:nucleoside-diphosphate-sugar epimerase